MPHPVPKYDFPPMAPAIPYPGTNDNKEKEALPAIASNLHQGQFSDSRIITIKLFARTKADLTGRRTFRPIAQIALAIPSLNEMEIANLGRTIARFNASTRYADDLTSERLLILHSMRSTGHYSERPMYTQEWELAWEYPSLSPLTRKNVISTLLKTFAQRIPDPPRPN